MATLVKNALKRSIVSGIYNDFITKSARYYYYLGKALPWDGTDTPETPQDNFQYEIDSRNNIISTKQISISDVSFITRRINWTSGVTYHMYDDTVVLDALDFYVMTDSYNVYKCISHNGTASTVKPSGNDSTSQTYADGYVWKFMYNIPVALRNKFMTTTYIPVMSALNNQFYSNGEITSITIENEGTGYSSATLAITGNGTGATASAILSAGKFTGYIITNPGEGYTQATISITGNGTGAELTPNLSVGDIDTLQANVELQAVNGSIEAIKIINGGAGYTSATVSISGDGTGAAATATVSGGVITKITMTNIGSGYSYITVIILGDGTGATARGILSPIGGHGKNATSELLSKGLMFYSSISNEKNQAMVVSNDYRQTGIIRHLEKYDDSGKFRSLNGSACFKITGTINVSKFPIDTIVYSSTNKEFVVVAVSSTAILLQSMDNAVPVAAGVYKNASLDTFTAVTVTPPTINKFSGELLYIDNRSGFTPTSSEAITIRTIIDL